MDKIKGLLLPLALVFAAIAIFNFGAQYGAKNLRVFAIAGQLQSNLNFYTQNSHLLNEDSQEHLEAIIDNLIVVAAIERQAWFFKLKDEPKATLDKVLADALSTRGTATVERFRAMEEGNKPSGIDNARLAEIRTALAEAKTELIDNASKITEKASSEQAAE